MNELLTSQPFVILTGAGASKWLGKATTFDIYDDIDKWANSHKLKELRLLKDFREYVLQQTGQSTVDLEYLLDYLQDLNDKLDQLVTVPQYSGHMNNLLDQRRAFEELYEQTLDFMVDYYGNIDGEKAVALYGRFFDGMRDLLAGSTEGRDILSIFTLNYDEAIELAVDEISKFELRDGFGSGHRRFWNEANFDAVTRSRILFPLRCLSFTGLCLGRATLHPRESRKHRTYRGGVRVDST